MVTPMNGAASVTDVDLKEIPAAVRQVMGDSLRYLYPAALRAVVQAGVADHLAAGPMTPQSLAAASGWAADHLKRVLRLLAMTGVFREDDVGAFHLTTAASLLRSDAQPSMAPLVRLFTSQEYWLPTGQLTDTVRAGSPVNEKIFGARFFDHVAEDKEFASVFHAGMDALSQLEQGPVADSYEFPASGTVVDIAGGLGGMLRAVLTRNPGLTGILFERESVLADHVLADPSIAGRWQTQAGDFFGSIPEGADVYLLKRIIHDKNDDDSVAILRACRAVMSDGARLLIIDPMVPAAGAPPSALVSDVLMMAVFEGRERTEDELAGLLRQARLRLCRVIQTPVSLAIAEVAMA
jgi:hypothetical protein